MTLTSLLPGLALVVTWFIVGPVTLGWVLPRRPPVPSVRYGMLVGLAIGIADTCSNVACIAVIALSRVASLATLVGVFLLLETVGVLIAVLVGVGVAWPRPPSAEQLLNADRRVKIVGSFLLAVGIVVLVQANPKTSAPLLLLAALGTVPAFAFGLSPEIGRSPSDTAVHIPTPMSIRFWLMCTGLGSCLLVALSYFVRLPDYVVSGFVAATCIFGVCALIASAITRVRSCL